jgi:hypothetical protein
MDTLGADDPPPEDQTWRPRAEYLTFVGVVVTKCEERGLTRDDPVPDDVYDEAATLLYGKWTPQARSFEQRMKNDGIDVGGGKRD